MFLCYFLAAFLTQTVCLDDTTVKFEIWDTAGQERYHSLAPMYYRGAQAAIVVYDITNQVYSQCFVQVFKDRDFLQLKLINRNVLIPYLLFLLGYIFTCPDMGKRIAASSQSKHSNSISWKQGRFGK
jgi:hypothetical protein